jgi:hypothetical protein
MQLTSGRTRTRGSGCVDSLQAEVEGHDTVGWLVGVKCED